ncbi:MAG: hypothetical protein JOZ82_01975 [Marmoricola sp.]|nr:hypothetical protein [Marmoricola sp.]
MTTNPTGNGPHDDAAEPLPPTEDLESETLDQDVDDRYPDEMTDPDVQTLEVPDPDAEEGHPVVPPPKSS